MINTLIFLAVAIIFIAVIMLWKYVDGLEDRITKKLSAKYKRSKERAKKALGEKRRTK